MGCAPVSGIDSGRPLCSLFASLDSLVYGDPMQTSQPESSSELSAPAQPAAEPSWFPDSNSSAEEARAWLDAYVNWALSNEDDEDNENEETYE